MPFKDKNKQRESARKYANKKYKSNPELDRQKAREWSRKWRADLKAEFLNEYGGACYCCTETEPVFLTVAHLDDSGAKHRKEIGGSQYLIKDLKNKGWPKDVIGILCMNLQS